MEEAYIVKVMEAMEYVDSKKDPETPILEALTQHDPDNAKQYNSLERDITSENTVIDDKEKGCMDNSHVP